MPRFRISYLTAVIAFALLFAANCVALRDDDAVAGWRSDVDFILGRLEAIHPQPWHKISKEEFTALADQLKCDIPSLDEDEIIVRLMQLVARLEDGHTYLIPSAAEGFTEWFPIRVDKFAEGIFVTAADKDHAALVGARVVRAGLLSAEEAFERVGSATSVDSPYSYPRTVPTLFSNVAVLKALGVIESKDALPLVLESADGGSIKVTIPSLSSRYSIGWALRGFSVPGGVECVNIFSGRESGLPLHLKNTSEPYWFELLTEHKTLYMQFNSVQNARNETFAAFVERLWKFYDEHEEGIDKFVLDIRYNAGGNGYLLPPFIHSLIKHDKISSRGHLYALVGSGSFSAATACLAQVIEHTGVITVGQVTSGPLNWCSDTVGQELPFSKLRMRISRFAWQKGHPSDDRGYYPPEFFVPLSATNFFAGKDTALEAILEGKVRTLADVLRNEGAEAFKAECKTLSEDYTDRGWCFPYSHFELRSLGYEMFSAGRVDEALAALELARTLHPQEWTTYDDLGDFYSEVGQNDKAAEHFRKALELLPGNYHIENKLNRLPQ